MNTPVSGGAASEREAFEAWFCADGTYEPEWIEWNRGMYTSADTENMWQAWQARAARTQPAVPVLASEPVAWLYSFSGRHEVLTKRLDHYFNDDDGEFVTGKPLYAAPQPAPTPSSITLDFKQATALLEMFGGEPAEITLMTGPGHSGEGLYAVYNADPEGAVYLGQTDEDAAPLASEPEPVAAEQAEPAGRVPDGVWEALQRMIEDGLIKGAGSQDDARTVSAYRDRVRFFAPFLAPETPTAEQARDDSELVLSLRAKAVDCAYVSGLIGDNELAQAKIVLASMGELLLEKAASLAAALASQSTPPPESAGQGLSDAVTDYLKARDDLDNREYAGINGEPWGVLQGRVHTARDDLDAAILAANRTAQPDGGSKA